MARKRKICATIMPQSEQQLGGMLTEVRRQKADKVEIRLDRMQSNALEGALKRISDIKHMAILTLRSKEEGGHYEGNDEKKTKILRILARQDAMLIDVEKSFAERNRGFIQELIKSDVRILASYHNFYATPSPRVLHKLYGEMSEFGGMVKIVTTALDSFDNLKIFGLYGKIEGKKNLISFAMGELGLISRIMSVTHYGAPFAYCSIGKPIAPGMLEVDRMREIFRAIP